MSTREVSPNLKPDGYGQCECGRPDRCYPPEEASATYRYGRLGKPDRYGKRHVRGCGCPSCLGRRNRRSGDDKARVARKRMGLGGPASRHEEHWLGPVRAEAKSGQQVSALATRFLAAEAQSNAQRPTGDNRPFAFVAMPAKWGKDGIVAVRLSTWEALIVPLLEEAS